MNTPQQKPPPKTAPKKAVARKTKNAKVDIAIYVEVLADKTDSNVKGGETKFNPVGAIADGKGGKNFYRTPGYSWEKKGDVKKVKTLSGPVEVKGAVKIQTSYRPSANPVDPSSYGRGTTPEDQKAGNTSLGFHESCHRNDYINYLTSKALPTFGGKPGMTEQQYKQAADAFGRAINKYFSEMEKDSIRRTDEVGYKKSMYSSKGSRP